MNCLTLGVLRTAACFATADLLTLDLARVARHESRLTQRLAQRLVVLHERAGNAVTNGAGLAGDAAAADVHTKIKLRGHLNHFQRLAHDHATGFATEELIE